MRKELARSFGATLVVLLTIVMTMGLMKTLSLAAGGRVAPQDVLLVLLNSLLHLPEIVVSTGHGLSRAFLDRTIPRLTGVFRA